MRVVLDTNVLVSAILFGGKPRQVLESIIAGHHLLLTSPPLLDELVKVLGDDKFRFPPEKAERVRQELIEVADLVAPGRRLHVVNRDPTGNRVIECAVSGKANRIVSGDKNLLGPERYRGIPLMSPTEFLTP